MTNPETVSECKAFHWLIAGHPIGCEWHTGIEMKCSVGLWINILHGGSSASQALTGDNHGIFYISLYAIDGTIVFNVFLATLYMTV